MNLFLFMSRAHEYDVLCYNANTGEVMTETAGLGLIDVESIPEGADLLEWGRLFFMRRAHLLAPYNRLICYNKAENTMSVMEAPDDLDILSHHKYTEE